MADADDLKYVVEFVDYGNIEVCKPDELRKGAAFWDVPILAHTCYLTDYELVILKHYFFNCSILKSNILFPSSYQIVSLQCRVSRTFFLPFFLKLDEICENTS